MDPRDPLDLKVRKVFRDLLVLVENKACAEKPDLVEIKVFLDPPDRAENKAHVERLVNEARVAMTAQKEKRVTVEKRATAENKVCAVLMEKPRLRVLITLTEEMEKMA